MKRREFLKSISAAAGASFLNNIKELRSQTPGQKPNIVFLLADQWRAQATGYSGNEDVLTPNLDKLAKESVNFTHAVSCCPVCTPYRASLITGQFPLTHGLFLNDLYLNDKALTIAEVYKQAGYETAYIGKWHLDGNGRDRFIPRNRRQGFDYWKVLECTHNYNRSLYYEEIDEVKTWEGYDAIAQTKDAVEYINNNSKKKPFILFLSWGPPHSPYNTAPQKYKELYENRDIKLRPNVPEKVRKKAIKTIKGYYAHITALDDCTEMILQALKNNSIEKNTILTFTSDHGDMLHSRGQMNKQRPWDESIRVPFLLKYPAVHKNKGRKTDLLINSPDIMPTLLGLSRIPIPDTVEGKDLSPVIRNDKKIKKDAALIMCPTPFGQWQRKKQGGKEYRGIRTKRYTYVKDLNGPWLLYDNEKDPYQMKNLCNNKEEKDLQERMDNNLYAK